MVVCFLIILHNIIYGQATVKYLWIAFYILLTLSMGYIFATNVKQIAFGGFVFVPLFFGLIASKHVQSLWHKGYIVMGLLFALTVVGVFIDYFVDVPWSGYMYEISDHELAASRNWHSFGFERVCGFTRTSTSAAAILILTGFYLIVRSKRFPVKLANLGVYRHKHHSYYLKRLNSFLHDCKRLYGLLQVDWKTSIRAGCLLLMLAVCMMPISTIMFDYSVKNGAADHDALYTLKSRLMNTWPEMLDQINESGNSVLGKGLGGVGISRRYTTRNTMFP